MQEDGAEGVPTIDQTLETRGNVALDSLIETLWASASVQTTTVSYGHRFTPCPELASQTIHIFHILAIHSSTNWPIHYVLPTRPTLMKAPEGLWHSIQILL